MGFGTNPIAQSKDPYSLNRSRDHGRDSSRQIGCNQYESVIPKPRVLTSGARNLARSISVIGKGRSSVAPEVAREKEGILSTVSARRPHRPI
jgi:hypothetical protein